MNGNRSQVYHPSGISSRGGTSMEAHSASSSSVGNDYDNDNDSTVQGLVTRPTTNRTLKFEPHNFTGKASSIPPMSSFFDKFNSNSQATSQSLHQRIKKLIKNERKMMKQKHELIKDINCWCNVLPNDDCKKLLYHFIKILETELESNELAIKKKDQINTQLVNVNKREKRTNDLKLKRNKMLIKLRENENKIGDSPITALTKENLEELECSVEIVEDQFMKSINNGLKNSIVDYVSTLKDTGLRYKDASEYFLENYYYASTKLNSHSNLQRLILQNKLNSAVPMSSSSSFARPLSQDKFHNSRYVALSANQVGKYLDNRFDTENNFGNKITNLDTSGHQSTISESNERVNNPTNVNNASELLSDSNNRPPPPPLPPPPLTPPPPATSSNSSEVQRQQLRPNSESADESFIVSSYSTPGSLTVRPNSQIGNNNHEWT